MAMIHKTEKINRNHLKKKEPNEALFISSQKWKQPTCPSTDEWIKKCGLSIQWNIIQP